MELSGPGVQYIADNQLVRRTYITTYTDYFLYLLKIWLREIFNLNITLLGVYIVAVKLFLSRGDIITLYSSRFNVPIWNRITNVYPVGLSGLVSSGLHTNLRLKSCLSPLFRKNGIDNVKRIHQQVIPLNNYTFNEIDP